MPKCENVMKCFSTVRFKPAASANSGYARLDLYHKVSVHASRYYLFIYSVRVYFFRGNANESNVAETHALASRMHTIIFSVPKK